MSSYYSNCFLIIDEATNNHMASKICLNEIKNSQIASIGPNFVVYE
jgi:hypothetical protein